MTDKQHHAPVATGVGKPRQPGPAKGAKSGVKPGATPARDPRDSGKRPVEEEDVFGGAERTRDGRISSDKAKP